MKDAKSRVTERLLKMKHQVSAKATQLSSFKGNILQQHPIPIGLMATVTLLCLYLIYQQNQIQTDPKQQPQQQAQIQRVKYATYVLVFVLVLCIIYTCSIIM